MISSLYILKMPQLRSCLLFFFSLILTTVTIAQTTQIEGTVQDARTHEKLAFVNIVVNDGEAGTTTNLDGQFQLRHSRPIQTVRFSYVGYSTHFITPDSTGTLNIYLQPAAARLAEVIVRSGANPAHRIIRLASQHRERHKPENLDAYSYRTYNKFILTAVGTADGAEIRSKPSLSRQDSAYLKMGKLLGEQHLFLSESITDYAFLKPNQHKETILATRVSGLEQPSFGIVAAEAREFSVYDDMPVFFGKRYLSPLSTGSTRKYNFLLEETSIVGSDTIYIISYKPEKGKNFDGLSGILYINSKGWAVQNVIAESAADDDKRGMKLQQQFEQVNGHWFPKELDVEITIPQVQLKGHQPFGHLRTYITNVQLNPPLRRRDFGLIALSQAPEAHRQPLSFWEQHRTDSLNRLEQRTYQQLDSTGKADNLEQKIRVIEYLTARQIPVGKISLDLNRFLRASDFEGLRLGVGAHTNNRFSERLTVGGYWGYGLGDEQHKYGADATLLLHKPLELKLAAAFFEDVLEPGGRRLPFMPRSTFNSLRPALLTHLDYTTHRSATLSSRLLRYLQVQATLRQEERRPTLAVEIPESPARHQVAEAVLGLRYAYGEQLVQLFNQTRPVPNSFPVLRAQYTRGLKGFLEGDYDYHKVDARLSASFRHRTTGETSFTLMGGLIKGDVPLLAMYNGYGSYNSSYKVYAGEGFETMAPYEFFSDRYTALFLQQDIGKRLLRTRFFQPNLVLLTNIGFGDLQERQFAEQEPYFKTMTRGFYESGLLLNDIISSPFSGVGIGFFYRYGPYALDKASDNFRIKLTTSLFF
ncbi:DUF5686 and carboxypeptidase-like regulatory domain-containing protein [Pontibacter beigongshangensis]|uniref:DUF5686 and carboxypeptidase-like regulatory domain-containing protein n=1 Tax=Pontibacter beigongshangensis TaxID=2574733 RepID=UPI00164F9641|nr:DUF5686 and carboxypeptidase-like regulatory domain-containing protein [Pontibacter beigongshangensis]